MKLIIASDIHGSVSYTKKLCEFIRIKNPDNIILLGDLLRSYHLSDDTNEYEVANLLNDFANKIISVRGNCDTDESNNLLIFDNNKLYKEITIDGIKFALTHGHLLHSLPFLESEEYLLSGHSHVYELSSKHLNPGSVGLPRQNPEHTCLYYENKTFYLINLDDFDTLTTISI